MAWKRSGASISLRWMGRQGREAADEAYELQTLAAHMKQMVLHDS